MMDETPQLSTTARALMKAAKADGPSDAARAKIWTGVAGAAGASVAVGGLGVQAVKGASAGAEAIGGVASGKLIALGALFGSALTIGLAMMMLRIGPARTVDGDRDRATGAARSAVVDDAVTQGPADQPAPVPASPLHAPIVAAVPTIPEVTTIQAAPPLSVPASASASGAPVGSENPTALTVPMGNGINGSPPAMRARHVVEEDTLTREAQLVAEARRTLAQGNATAALASIRATQRLSTRALEPEELSIESHALRALGRDDEAMALDLLLRSRFPDHALAR